LPSTIRSIALIAFAALGLAAFAFWPRAVPVDPAQAPLLDSYYALPLENVETHVLGRGETLTNVLARASITGQDMAELLLSLRGFLNPRRLSDGVEITVRRLVDDRTPRGIDVRVNADSTLRLVRLSDGWKGRILETPVMMDTVYVAGEIEKGRTLYEALVLDEDSPLHATERLQLVGNLAELYEFKLDFTREIQPGDTYRLVYEREARPDGTARGRRILIAELVNSGVTYPAIWFSEATVEGYYDAEGKPLKSGFSRYPVKFLRITSRFNPNRYHPILRTTRAHLGTDYGATSGTEVYATADGTVSFRGVSGGYGNMVRIRHANGYETRYAHLSRFSGSVRSGTKVKQGALIGYVGSTGLATGPHLHYELWQNGRALDATRVKPEAPPLGRQFLSPFLQVAARREALLSEATQRYLASQAGQTARLAEQS
jgi:murein DD-endopeptidase MepM/ murein hydrolase activator NlpD